MSSRLFKFGMVAGGRPPNYPHMATSLGDVFQYDATTDSYSFLLKLVITGNGECAFSPDGKFIVFSNNANPNYYLFKRTSSGYVSVTLPGTTGLTYAVAWSKDGKYLMLGGARDAYWWKRNADDSFTQLTVISAVTASGISGIAFSPDSQYVVFAHNSTGYLKCYKITNDVAALASYSGGPSANAEKVAFLDNTTFVYPQTGANLTLVYRFDTATDIAARYASAAVTDKNAYSVAVSPDGQYFAIGAMANSGTLNQYKYDGTNITKLALADVRPVGTSNGLSYSPDGNYLSVADASAPYVYVYKRVGDTLTKIPDLSGGTQVAPKDITFAPAVNV